MEPNSNNHQTETVIDKYDQLFKRDIIASVTGIVVIILFSIFTLAVKKSNKDWSFVFGMLWLIWMIIAIIWVIKIAKHQNRNATVWGIFAFIIPFLAIIIIGLLKKQIKPTINPSMYDSPKATDLLLNGHNSSNKIKVDNAIDHIKVVRIEPKIKVDNAIDHIKLAPRKPIVKEIRALKLKFLVLSEKHIREATIIGYGASQGIEIIKTICEVCEDVIRALEKGIGVDGAPISRQQISNGLKKLIANARTDLGIVAINLNPDGVQLYQIYLKQLEDIANKIG